eukprot:1441754-Heterocapsa_arctica.AAC.1
MGAFWSHGLAIGHGLYNTFTVTGPNPSVTGAVPDTGYAASATRAASSTGTRSQTGDDGPALLYHTCGKRPRGGGGGAHEDTALITISRYRDKQWKNKPPGNI